MKNTANSERLSNEILQKRDNLIAYIDQFPMVAIAVSGGIDSMLLAYLAHRFSRADVAVVHAQSPAVPTQALQRILNYAERENWSLKLVNAGEFEDANYLKNPANRCYFCKSNLYNRVASCAQGVIFSGTNLDDLNDYRPGLVAAQEQSVCHPYVEVQITKAEIYQLARFYQLTELQDLPAQPCLASRVETGIQITKKDLDFIDKAEQFTRHQFADGKNIRCRITHQGVVIEFDCLPRDEQLIAYKLKITELCAQHSYLFCGVRKYQRGSAFLLDTQNRKPPKNVIYKEVVNG
ncbi:hypothetical protein [Catenovulum sediminis]|uniref:hypothetical protein n=1 Tax=Catenovulum sediminis TaxID=1740262 RepID=UPI00118094D6|nr:hypothetical protein [Catenovulum sediminis]